MFFLALFIIKFYVETIYLEEEKNDHNMAIYHQTQWLRTRKKRHKPKNDYFSFKFVGFFGLYS